MAISNEWLSKLPYEEQVKFLLELEDYGKTVISNKGIPLEIDSVVYYIPKPVANLIEFLSKQTERGNNEVWND